MQSRSTFALVLTSFLTAAALSSGCIIVSDPNNNTGGNGGDGGAGVGASGGTGGTGGQGGTGGVGGTGGTGGTGGEGGGSNCVGPEDGDGSVAACDAMNITPKPEGPAAQCPGTDPNGNPIEFDPPGYGTCKRGFEIYTRGAATVLQNCLSDIGVEPANACDDQQVADCVGKMYGAACPSADAALACETISNQLCINGETFDTQGCQLETNPFNNAALQELANCISDSALPDCNDAYDACFAQVTSY
ncbi:hypothetical protein [Polyangium jinanense]|uniref:Uncharacterized protein n=1 Tax=Polyangium jinanense TaxID=2829994 RepID=A0A9X3X1T2_9BACT|nr:hypothetical protein [Polyangium jinanense]MDC3952257.1 hypothetical protein [Polyangium jinanense]MDC3956402.1 hypothetical protein [Polyangium jinanense]MDC3979886.1 hypothetical protein [Polyangium jinanense]MDC3982539.1 hypothetical protein [Polyangium jinanense]